MQAIEKQLCVLESILKLKHEDGFSIADIVNETGLNLSTVHRICSILVKRGYLYQKYKRGKYLIGQKFLLFSGINRHAVGIKEQALPFLDKLCKDTSETVDLILFDGTNLFSMATIFPKQFLQAVPDTENVQPFPLHCTAIGKTLLACLSDEEYEKIITGRVLTAYTDNTLTDKAQLKKEIETIKRENIAYDIEEYFIGIMSIAVPIRDSVTNPIGAVSIVGPSIRLNKPKLEQFAPLLKDCALQISHSLGYRDK